MVLRWGGTNVEDYVLINYTAIYFLDTSNLQNILKSSLNSTHSRLFIVTT